MTVLPQQVTQDVRTALAEDIGRGDLTSRLVQPSKIGHATILARESAVVCGIPWANEVFRQLDKNIVSHWVVSEGELVGVGQPWCNISGRLQSILTGERTVLNFLQFLSGISTLSRKYVELVNGTRAKILDTRKTIPGLRVAQKYAVRCGGAHNHRLGLYDGILIKENHVRSIGSLREAIKRSKEQAGDNKMVEVEIEAIGQLKEAISAGATQILLDNFSLTDLKKAVQINQNQAILEASGGITLENVREVAETGVNKISCGTLTKNIRSIDLTMQFNC